MIPFTWIGFFLSIAVLMVISRRTLAGGLSAAAVTLGVFSLSPIDMLQEILNALTDISVLLLALTVGIIPIIGGALEESGLIDDLVANLKLGKKTFLAFSPALFGSLPMPGGALLSAPLVERGGKGVSAHKKTAVNVWFRHLLLIIYPLGALLATTKIAEVDLFEAILYLIPGFFLALLLGYLFLLRDISGNSLDSSPFSAKKLAVPLGIILTAPVLDLLLLQLFKGIIPEAPLTFAVFMSLLLAFYFGDLGLKDLKLIGKKMEPWNFAFIILSMFIFLNIFKASDAPELIASLSVSKPVLMVLVGALLGFITGRVQVPISILVPIYFSKYGVSALTPITFAITYFSIFMGYMISPVHPCVSVSIVYFGSTLKDFFKVSVLPSMIGLGIAFILASMIL
ncbi:MAG: DUF401 family protein [Euryarchaeota archaeon]|nr:DUF401 family protein [Euryarchaeota archaeon]